MNVLGIETATSVCAVALVRDGEVVGESLLDEGRVHAERLMGQIVAVLGPAGAESLGGIAVSIGPGSFTGLRIGVSVAKGIAFARGIPLAGVPTLGALALHAAVTDRLQRGTRLLAALDARRDEVYCQLFEVTEEGALPLWEPRDATVGELMAGLEGSDTRVTGDAAGKLLSRAGAAGRLSAVSPEALRTSGASVALLGGKLLREGKSD
ncbi:MAG TPA: tRNA (adenosine(37)-N6)-threonylcarbamoyltransferase complex dimerization subunit type 1 TsaB, partial [Bacteroidota bacterium]|nr:tRNA (adenosine(37)-N6)-threonylcarbamoyltransferase complex dimerization subunit type 1 TsaB [Bacteroidota bacterium]